MTETPIINIALKSTEENMATKVKTMFKTRQKRRQGGSTCPKSRCYQADFQLSEVFVTQLRKEIQALN
ncbi:MAG: hypothetical protein RL329_3400 [Bacteroidota bacterium]|jgi:hypothetical protein